MVYPNPSTGRFKIDLHLSDNISTSAKIELSNLVGQRVHVEQATITNGLLQKTISMSSMLAHGTYVVKVIVSDKIYQAKLVYAK